MNQKNSGLTGLRFDLRDRFFSHSKLFGAPDPSTLPKLGLNRRPPFAIKNQGFTSFCPFYSTSAGREYQEGIELSPEAQVLLGSRVAGYSVIAGADARDALRTLTKYGSVEKAKVPQSVGNYSPEQLSNPANFSPTLETEGKKHLAHAFFQVDGPYDMFDNIRIALALGAKEKQVVYVAGRWFPSWNSSGGKKIITDCTGVYALHMYIIIDWTQIDGVDVLVIQNSYGTATGDQGLQYIAREAINESFRYGPLQWLFGPRLGAFIVRDMPQEKIAETKATVAYKVAATTMNVIKAVTPTPTPLTNSERLYKSAYSLIGTDASPKDRAPDELGCVDSVNEVYRKAFGANLTTPDTFSTTTLYRLLKTDPRFHTLLSSSGAKPGDIIISPTGLGSNPNMPHGHVGIVGKTHIMSNSSKTGIWEANYTLDSWYKYYAVKGGYPVVCFRLR